ncbi:MAG: AMP-binding protein [Gemmatimonadota bacterium]
MDRIASYLSGRTLLITGATGFLGQPLVEKILWTAPDVGLIHLLIRPKRPFGGAVQTADERLRREFFPSSVFDRLRLRHGDAFESFLAEKVVAVAGDVSQEGLGLSDDDALRLRRTVDVLINSAAVVSFDAPLDDALELNTLGAARVAAFAASCDHAILIHVSTAYVSGATNETIPETIHHHAHPDQMDEAFPVRRFSDPERDIAHVRSLIAAARARGESPEVRRELVVALVQRGKARRGGKHVPRKETIESLRARWIERRLVEEGMRWARERGWNDTYTYTKALGEQMVLRARGTMPTVIARPAIIESSLAEPSPGWLDGLRMADPLIAAIGKGRLRELPLDPAVTLDLVPVDMVVNTMLASIPAIAESGGVQVYQIATGSRNPVTLGRLHELIVAYFIANPMLDKAGEPIRVKPLTFPGKEAFRRRYRRRAFPLARTEKLLERFSALPGLDQPAQKARRRLAATRAAIDKLFYYGELYEPYLNLDCRFEVANTMRLFEGLSADERRRYPFDVTRLNWRHYIHIHIAGIKKYILKIERAGTMAVADAAAAHEAAVTTIGDVIEGTAARLPDRVALQIQRDGQWERWTYAQLRDAARDIADHFRRLGLTRGDRVVLFSENQPEWGAAYLGAARAGLVVVPLDAQTWHREVWATARFTGARAILASAAGFRRLPPESLEANERDEAPIWLLNVNARCAPFAVEGLPRSTQPPAAVDAPPAAVVEADDLASIIFTTGTAVDPKGAMHTHRNFLNNLFGVCRYLPVAEHDQFLSVLPLYHALEFTCGFLTPLYYGGTITYARSLKPKVLLETMRETGTTVMQAVPTVFALIRDDLERRVLGSARSPLRSNLMTTSKQLSRRWERTFRTNIGSRLFARAHAELGGRVRILVSGGSALGGELYDTYRTLGLPIYEGYGLTETAPVLTVNPQFRSRRGSAGQPLPGVELRLYHTNREGIGEIIVRSPSLMAGYYRNPAATARAMVDGWFHTGDLGWVDADGYLYLTGRIKDVIVTGAGKNVYPADLEAIYREIPLIQDVCVLGVRNGLTEDIHAVVVPDPAAVAGEDPAEARRLIQREIHVVARELPSYHRLQHIHLWDDPLPVTDDGAIDRGAVRRRLQDARRGAREPAPAETPRASGLESGGSPEAEVIAELSRLSRVPVDEITPASHLYDELGLDSLLGIELLLFLEHRFGISLADEAATSLQTVGQLLEAVHAPGAGPGSKDAPAANRPRVSRPRKTGAAPAAAPPALRSARRHAERSPLDRALFSGFRRGLRSLYGVYFDLRVVGGDHLPEAPPSLLASNHASHLDAPAIFAAVERVGGASAARQLHVLGARDYFFDTAMKRWFFSTFLNVVPLERTETSLAGLRMVKTIISRGESALIFPEGSRSRSGTIQAFKPGLGLLAWELRVPIIPVYVGGTFGALPPGNTLPRHLPVTVTFGQPITMDTYADGASQDARYRAITADVRAAIQQFAGETPSTG